MRRPGAVLALAVLAAASLPLLSIGCDDAADSLTNGRSGAGGSHGVNGSSGGVDDSTAAGGGDPAAAANAKALFLSLDTQLASTCGPCHTTGASSAPMWLGSGDPNAQYTTITQYKGIIASDPTTSILVTKPQHEGPALSGDLLAQVTAWLAAEATAAGATSAASTTVQTDAVAIPTGAGTITLPAPGGQLSFTATMTGDILSLKSVALVAPAATGIDAKGIHIILVHADGTSTDDESIAGEDTTSPKGATTPVGVGLVIIPQVAATDKIQLQIDSLVTSTATGTTTVLAGGCKSVQAFQTNAAPQMMNLCLGCHNTGGSGNGSLDMSALGLATPDYTTACNQAKAKIDTTNVAQSEIITTPTGGDPNHPLKTAPQTFVTAMTTWINAEK